MGHFNGPAGMEGGGGGFTNTTNQIEAPPSGGGSMSGGAIAGYAMAAYQVISGLQMSELAKEQAKYTAKVTAMNAEYAELDAYEAEKYGTTQQARYQTVIDKTLSDQRAGYAAKEIDVNFGTAKQVQDETVLTGRLNLLDIQQAAHQKAMGYQREASNIRLGGSMNALQSEASRSANQNAAVLNASSTALSGYRFDKYGV